MNLIFYILNSLCSYWFLFASTDVLILKFILQIYNCVQDDLYISYLKLIFLKALYFNYILPAII